MVRKVRGTNGTKSPRKVRKVHGTNRPWYEKSTNGTKRLWYEKSGIHRHCARLVLGWVTADGQLNRQTIGWASERCSGIDGTSSFIISDNDDRAGSGRYMLWHWQIYADARAC